MVLALAVQEIWDQNIAAAQYQLEINPISSAIETAIESIWKAFKIQFLIPKRAIAMVEAKALILRYIDISHKTYFNKSYHWEHEMCSTKSHW